MTITLDNINSLLVLALLVASTQNQRHDEVKQALEILKQEKEKQTREALDVRNKCGRSDYNASK